MYISFNELSINNKFPCDEEIDAKERFNEFLKFVKTLTTEGIMEGLLLSEEELLSNITETYSIADWYKDPTVKFQYKQYFRSFLGKYCNRLKTINFCSEYEITFEGESYKSIGGLISIENDTPLLSILTNTFWNQKTIGGEYCFLDNDGNFVAEEKTVTNWAEGLLVQDLKREIREKQYREISSGDDLWEQREFLSRT